MCTHTVHNSNLKLEILQYHLNTLWFKSSFRFPFSRSFSPLIVSEKQNELQPTTAIPQYLNSNIMCVQCVQCARTTVDAIRISESEFPTMGPQQRPLVIKTMKHSQWLYLERIESRWASHWIP